MVSDDVVLMTLQYSTQWDSFAHIGSRFDADGDGKRESCSTTATALTNPSSRT